MPNSLKPVARQELLDTADNLFYGCDLGLDSILEFDGIDIPTELEFKFESAEFSPGRLLVSGMMPEHMIASAKREFYYNNIRKGLAEKREEKQRNQPPFVKAMRRTMRGFMPNYNPPTEGDFIPEISAEDVIRAKRSLNLTLEESGQPNISVTVEQWSFLGALTIKDCRFTLDPTARGLYVHKHNLSDEQEEVGHSNSAGYLLLPYSVDAFEDINGYNTDNSCKESPIPPFTESPAHPSALMQIIMQTLIDRS